MNDSVITFVLMVMVAGIVILAVGFSLRGYLRELERAKRRSPVGAFIAFSVVVFLYISGLLAFIFA